MGTHYKGSRQEMLVLDTYIKLARAAETVSDRICKVIGLKEKESIFLES